MKRSLNMKLSVLGVPKGQWTIRSLFALCIFFTSGSSATELQEAPTAPHISSLTSSGRTVTIQWVESEDDSTSKKDMTYRVYYSESVEKELRLLGEVAGSNTLSADNLPTSIRLHFYVSAVDSNGVPSQLSEPAAIATGEEEPVLRDDLELIDLEEIGAVYERLDGNRLIIKSLAKPHNFKKNDVVISYLEEGSFAGKVLKSETTNGVRELVFEPMNVFELFSSGNFNMSIESGGSK